MIPGAGERVRGAREAKGLSEAEVARRIGIDEPLVYDLETYDDDLSSTLSLQQLCSLAALLSLLHFGCAALWTAAAGCRFFFSAACCGGTSPRGLFGKMRFVHWKVDASRLAARKRQQAARSPKRQPRRWPRENGMATRAQFTATRAEAVLRVRLCWNC